MDSRASVVAALRRGPAYGLDLRAATGLSAGRLHRTLTRLRAAGDVRAEWSAGRCAWALTASGRARVVRRPAVALAWLPAVVIAAVSAYVALARPDARRLTDLGVYVGAVSTRQHGDSLYAFISAGHAPFTYPPFAALLFWPLTLVGAAPLQVLWTGATIAVTIWIAYAATPRRALVPAVAAVLLLSAPVSSDLKYGQVSVLLAGLVLADVRLLRHHRGHGVLIGLAAAVKLTPLVFVPMLWLSGRRRAAVVAAAVFGACGTVAWLALPADSPLFWGTEMWHVERLGYITSVGNQSLNGALMRLGVADPTRSLVTLVVAGALTAVALWRSAHLIRRGDWLAAVVVTGAAGIVVSPVSWTHHQIWLVLAVLLPVGAPGWPRRAWVATVLAVMVLPVTAVPGLGDARLLLAIAIACVVRPRASAPVPPQLPAGDDDQQAHDRTGDRRA